MEQSKDLNKEIIKKQAVTQENIGSEIDEDEIPLNDPFAGDVGTSTSTTNTGFLSDNAEEERNQMLEDKKRKGQINFGLISSKVRVDK